MRKLLNMETFGDHPVCVSVGIPKGSN